MQMLYTGVSLFLLLNLLAGLLRILLGPTPADRLLTTQLLSTTAVAMLLLHAEASAEPAWRDVALVFALLAAVTAVAFVRRVWAREG
jgi:multicomponent Na+:H+ antiporter subunit F